MVCIGKSHIWSLDDRRDRFLTSISRADPSAAAYETLGMESETLERASDHRRRSSTTSRPALRSHAPDSAHNAPMKPCATWTCGSGNGRLRSAPVQIAEVHRRCADSQAIVV